MSAKLVNRINSLRVLTSLVGIVGMGSLVGLPAFSQTNESPTDANTLPRGTVDAPAPSTPNSNNNYPVNQSTPAITNQDGTMMTPECINPNQNGSPATTNLNSRNTEPDLNNQTARDIAPTTALQDCGTRMTPSTTNQDGTVVPDRTNQDGTSMPDSNNQEGPSVGPGFNNSDDNVAPPGATNAPDPNLEPRLNN